jgi:hypothetical protein
VQFRSLHSLARRTLAAGAASALALTLFNAVQPTLAPHHQIGPGTIKDVPVTLVPTAAAPTAATDRRERATPTAPAPTGAVDNAGPRSSGSATLPLRGAEPGAGSVKAAPAAAPAAAAGAGAGAELLSAPVPVGKARFVGVSWLAPAVGPPASLAGAVWLRARTAAGWRAGGRSSRPPTGPTPTPPSTGGPSGSTATGSGWTPGPPRCSSGSTSRPRPRPRPRPAPWSLRPGCTRI